MPDDRFLHRKAGHGQKPNQLGSDEYRVWTQYLLSADDFGVMRASAVTLRSDNDFLDGKTEKQVQRWLDAVIASGLLQVFAHQGRSYAFQHDWQTWQKVNYPRTTNNPIPPAECLALCDEPTRRLFGQHPGGAGRTRQNGSENVPRTDQELSSLMRGRGHAKRLTANGLRQTANGSETHTRAMFDSFWAEYPLKKGKDAALKSWLKLAPDVALVGEIIAAVQVQAAQPQWTKDGGQFIPHASTWLNQRRWEDEMQQAVPQVQAAFTGREQEAARSVRRAWGRCMHADQCADSTECLGKIIHSQRGKSVSA